MNEPINHGVPTAVQLQWRRRRPRMAAARYIRRYGRDGVAQPLFGLTGYGSNTSVDTWASIESNKARHLSVAQCEISVTHGYVSDLNDATSCGFICTRENGPSLIDCFGRAIL